MISLNPGASQGFGVHQASVRPWLLRFPLMGTARQSCGDSERRSGTASRDRFARRISGRRILRTSTNDEPKSVPTEPILLVGNGYLPGREWSIDYQLCSKVAVLCA